MVDFIDIGFGSMAGYGSGIGTVVLIILLVVLAAVLGFMVWNFSRYKYKYIVRELSHGRKRIFTDKARIYRDKKGVEYWKLLKHRVLVPVPPSEALDIDTKGKYFVEAYKTPGGEFHYLVDSAELDPDDPKLEPVTTNQRAMLADQIKLAHDRRRKSIWENLQPIASGLMVVAVFVILIAFYGKIAEPFHKSQELQAANQKQINEALHTINQILDERQEVKPQEMPVVIPS